MVPTGATSFEGLVLSGAARDALAGADGLLEPSMTASLRATVSADRTLSDLDPMPPGGEALVGLRVGSGFRAAIAATLPDEVEAATPLYLLLDDLPVAALISGYADLYAGALPSASGRSITSSQADICAGWATDATMLQIIETEGRMPTPVGPPAPNWDARDGQSNGWHPIAPLGKGAMRRRRIIEVAPDGPGAAIRAAFRDTHVGPDGIERVLHEYRLTASLDLPSGVLADCRAEARVLPWPECPLAAASAERLDGRPVGEVRDLVRRELRGRSTCTHLNDLLRSLTDVVPLARLAGLHLQSAG